MLDKIKGWLNRVFPQRFDFRYDKIVGTMVTVPVGELKDWDEQYERDCKDLKIKP